MMKMIEQQIKVVTPDRRAELRHVGIQLAVSVQPDGQIWKYCAISFGRHVLTPSFEECKESWPRDAIELVREQLDALEAKLEEDE